MSARELPPVARAFAFYAPTIEARLSSLHYRVQRIARTFNRKTGEVDLQLEFRDDEDRFDCLVLARNKLFQSLIDLGFIVKIAGVDNHIRIGGYYGDRAALEVPATAEAAPGLAKVIPIADAAARRAS